MVGPSLIVFLYPDITADLKLKKTKNKKNMSDMKP